MRISRTPLRISLVGGGTDMPAFYRKHGGAVVSFAIDKYVYVAINEKFDKDVRLSYSVTENVPSADALKHDIVRETLKLMGIESGIEIVSIADVPGKGTGLGSSSAFACGLIKALGTNGFHFNQRGLAEMAYTIERTLCNKPVGKQDHYAASYGGFNYIQFQPENVKVTPLRNIELDEIQKKFLLLYTGVHRSADPILDTQEKNLTEDKDIVAVAQRMKLLADDLYRELERGQDKTGEFLHQNWELKKKLGNISNPQIDQWYEDGRKAGAIGGKLCGAGGGGFLLFYAPQSKHADIINATGLRQTHFRIEKEGSKIIYGNTN